MPILAATTFLFVAQAKCLKNTKKFASKFFRKLFLVAGRLIIVILKNVVVSAFYPKTPTQLTGKVDFSIKKVKKSPLKKSQK